MVPSSPLTLLLVLCPDLELTGESKLELLRGKWKTHLFSLLFRYAWMMFEQPSSFTAPEGLSAAGTAPSHWSVNSYVQQTGLQLVAASFFTVQPNGEPTGSVATTQAVVSS